MSGPVFSLAHCSMFDFDIIYNRLSSLLVNIVSYTPLRIVVSLTILIKCFIWDLTFYSSWEPNISSFDTICNSSSPPLVDIIHFSLLRIVINLTVLKTRLLRRSFHTLIRNVSFPSPTDVRSHYKHQT